jgi:hypothetical protein
MEWLNLISHDAAKTKRIALCCQMCTNAIMRDLPLAKGGVYPGSSLCDRVVGYSECPILMATQAGY